MADGAGWFADPSGKASTFRWWDGQAWTRWLSADPAAPDPGPVPLGPPPGPGPLAATAVGPRGAAVDVAPPDEVSAYPPPAEDQHPAYAPPDPADRAVGLPAAAAIIVGGVVLAIIAVGAIISLTADRPLTGPAVPPPAPIEPPLNVVYDPATRQLSAQELRVTMPDKPFSCDLEPRAQPDVFTSTFACRAWVHFDYNAQHADWVAITGLGVLEERLRTGPDLTEIAVATFTALAAQSYDPDTTTMKKQRTEPLTGVAPNGKAVLVSAEMHVADKDLPTKYDRLLVAVFELESGKYAAYYAIRPDDSKKDVVDALRRSAETVSARK